MVKNNFSVMHRNIFPLVNPLSSMVTIVTHIWLILLGNPHYKWHFISLLLPKLANYTVRLAIAEGRFASFQWDGTIVEYHIRV